MPLRKAGASLVDLAENMSFPSAVPAPVVKETVLKSAVMPKADKPMTRDDWNAKDRRISRQGLFQAALQSPALMQYAPTLEAYIELVVRTADAGLAYVNE